MSDKQPDNDRLLTVREVARRLQLSTAQIYKMIQAGEIPGVIQFDTGRIRVDPDALQAFINSHAGYKGPDIYRRQS